MTYISWSSDFVLYLQDYLSVIFSDNETVWPKFWPQSKYKSTWPMFHGLVILLNIVKIIGIMHHQHHPIHWPYQVYVGQWPIFYGPAILLHISKTYLMEKRCTWDNGSLWLRDRPCKIYVGQWPVFHGPLILPYIIVRFKLFLYIKKWHRPGVFVPLRALALVLHMLGKGQVLIWASSWDYGTYHIA